MPERKRVIIYTRISKDDTGAGRSNDRQSTPVNSSASRGTGRSCTSFRTSLTAPTRGRSDQAGSGHCGTYGAAVSTWSWLGPSTASPAVRPTSSRSRRSAATLGSPSQPQQATQKRVHRDGEGARHDPVCLKRAGSLAQGCTPAVGQPAEGCTGDALIEWLARLRLRTGWHGGAA